jgi:sulfur-oxidizing protein SoxY
MAALAASARSAAAQAAPAPDPWPDLRDTIFAGRQPLEDPSIVTLEAPTRAEDAALVPVAMLVHAPPVPALRARRLWLVIDENPMPLAGLFTLGESADVTRIATRVRVNSYTNMRLVAELADGSLHMATRYVKAAGGCSAPATKSPDEAMASLGRMRFRTFGDLPDGHREALIMLRHPNTSGMQMDQLTRMCAPARYIERFTVTQGGALIFSMVGGISISEDPNFRFTYRPDRSNVVAVDAVDIEKTRFAATWPALSPGG